MINNRHNSFFQNNPMTLSPYTKVTSKISSQSNTTQKMKLNPNSIFAFQENDKYSSFTNYNEDITRLSEGVDASSESENENEGDDVSERDSKFSNQISEGNYSLQFFPTNNNATMNRRFSANPGLIYPNIPQIHNYTNSQMNLNFLRRNTFDFFPNNFPVVNRKGSVCFSNYSNSNSNSYQNLCQNNDRFFLENANNFLFDQTHCRQMQDKLEEKKNDVEFICSFYEAIQKNLIEYIDNQFGNYVVQKLFEVFLYQNNKPMVTEFFTRIQGDLVSIALHNFGTRVLQKALERLDEGVYEKVETETTDMILRHFVDKNIVVLSGDKNGNHVLQKIIRIFPKQKNQFIYDDLTNHIVEIGKLKQGAIILQTAVKYSTEEQKEQMIKKILDEFDILVNDEYGNYIIQYILEFKEKRYNDVIYDYISKNIVQLSKLKYSSNVIDKCIIQEEEISSKIIQKILDDKLIHEMINDQYGNYVIQKALKVSFGKKVFYDLINQIKPQMDYLLKTNIGKKIYDHIIAQYSEYFDDKHHCKKKPICK